MPSNTFAAEAEAFAIKMYCDRAEYEFYSYCAEGPGVKASDVLYQMEGKRNKAFWDAALYNAMGHRAAWLAE